MERNKARKSRPPDTWRVNGVVVKAIVGVGLAVGLVLVLDFFGQRARHAVVPDARYSVRIAEIDCPTPPRMDLATFLTEVRYLSGLPETVQSVDPETPERLRQAFALHPWVKKATGVSVGTDGRVRVSLEFRSPILAIHVAGEQSLRALDVSGILLPQGAPTEGLAVLVKTTPGPGTAGQPWPDADARRAAELAAAHPSTLIEKRGNDWILTQAGGRVIRVAAP